MNPILGALGALALLITLLVAGLGLAARWARRQRAHPDTAGTPQPATIALPATGYLTDGEAAAADDTDADIARLAMVERAVMHRVNACVERAIRQLLEPQDRAWIRVHTGEFALVGVA